MSSFETSIPLRFVEGTKSFDREADVPPNDTLLTFGMHGDVAAHYKAKPSNPLPSTLDYLAASIGGCLIGTLAGSLMRARIPVTPGGITGSATGLIEADGDGVLNLKRVTMQYEIELDDEHRAAAEEVLAVYADKCPNARSVTPAIEIVSEMELKSAVVA